MNSESPGQHHLAQESEERTTKFLVQQTQFKFKQVSSTSVLYFVSPSASSVEFRSLLELPRHFFKISRILVAVLRRLGNRFVNLEQEELGSVVLSLFILAVQTHELAACVFLIPTGTKIWICFRKIVALCRLDVLAPFPKVIVRFGGL